MQNEKRKIAEGKTRSDIKERTYKFSLAIIILVDSLPSSRTTSIIIDQLLRSAFSIGANIMEAQAASTTKDFKNYLTYAL